MGANGNLSTEPGSEGSSSIPCDSLSVDGSTESPINISVYKGIVIRFPMVIVTNVFADEQMILDLCGHLRMILV